MKQQKSSKGIALLTAIVFLTIMMAIVGIGTIVGVANYRLAKDNKTTIQAEHAADSAIERTIFEFWHVPNHLAKQEGLGDQLAMNKYKGVLDGTIDLGADLPILLAGENSTFGDVFQLTGTLNNGASYEAAIRRKDVGNSVIINIVAKGIIGNSERYVTQTLTFDSANPWNFAILTDNIECSICHLEVYSIEAGYKPDGQLRNFFTDALDDIHNLERIRVGSISNLNLNSEGYHKETDSYILGTLYTSKDSDFVSGQSTIFTPALQENTSLIDAGENFSNTFKTIAKWNDASQDSVQDCNRDDCSAYGTLYTQYPNSDKSQPDGLLQDTFPLPIQDDNNNRLIDDKEWDKAIRLGGSVSVNRNASTFNILNQVDESGIILVPHGQNLNTANVSQKTFTSNSAHSRNGGHHAIFRGTKGSPLVLDGKVYVNGDVIISGRVSGDGMILARGNVYIVGDVVYDCGRELCDYTKPELLPRFGLAAGGNVTSALYSYMAGHGGMAPSQDVTTSITGSAIALQTSLTQTGSTELNSRFIAQDFGFEIGDLGRKYFRTAVTSLASSQIMNFNQKEHERSQADNTYIPRLYIFRQGEHDWIQRCKNCFQYWPDFQTSMRGERTAHHLDGNPIESTVDNTLGQDTSINKARFVSLSPQDHWTLGGYSIQEADFNIQFPSRLAECSKEYVDNYINSTMFSTQIQSNGTQKLGETFKTSSEACYETAVARERLRSMNAELVLWKMWQTYVEDSNSRNEIINKDVDGTSFRFDGIIYTANALFFLAPSSSATQGEILINGALIVADMGILSGGKTIIRGSSLRHSNPNEENGRGTRLQYDRRLIELISDVGESVGVGKSSFEILTATKAQQLLGSP